MERFGDWIAEAEIGEGGFARVYRAHHAERPDQRAAIKVLLPEWRRRRAYRDRFADEARTQELLGEGAVRSTALPAFLQADIQAATPWIAIEWIDGRSLQDMLADGRTPEGGLLPRDTMGRAAMARDVGLAIAEALAYAHRRGIVHRDIKPENVLATAAGRYVVIDFGIARDAREQRQTTEGMPSPMTPAYAAPELLEARVEEHFESSLDIYAIGCTLFEVLTGRLSDVDTAQTITGQTRWVARSTPLDAREVAPDDLAALIATCTEPDASLRPSIGQLLAQLQRLDLHAGGAPMTPLDVAPPTAPSDRAAGRTLAPPAPPGGPTILPAELPDDAPELEAHHPARRAASAHTPPFVDSPHSVLSSAQLDDVDFDVLRKRSPWPWLALFALLAAAGVVAAQQPSWLPMPWPDDDGSLSVVDVHSDMPAAAEPADSDAAADADVPGAPAEAPEPEPTSKPEPEPESKPKPKPEPESKPKPKPESKSKPKPKPEPETPRVEDLLAEPAEQAPDTGVPRTQETVLAYARSARDKADRGAFIRLANAMAKEPAVYAKALSPQAVAELISLSMVFRRLPYPPSGAHDAIAAALATVPDNSSCVAAKTWLRWSWGDRAIPTSDPFFRRWCRVCVERYNEPEADSSTCGDVPQHRWVDGHCVHVDTELFPRPCPD